MCDSHKTSLRKPEQRCLLFIDSTAWVLAVMFGTLAPTLNDEPMIYTQAGKTEWLGDGGGGGVELPSY